MERKQDETGIGQAKSKRWTAKDGARVVAAWRRSGLEGPEYCKRAGVAPHRLAYWSLVIGAKSPPRKGQRKPVRRRAAQPSATFLPVVVRRTEAAPQTQQPAAWQVGERMQATPSRIDPEWAAHFVLALFAAEGSR